MEDDDLLSVERIDQYVSLCISTLSRKSVEEADVPALGSPRGFFVYEVDERQCGGGMQILAKVASLEAAFRLAELLKNMRQPTLA